MAAESHRIIVALDYAEADQARALVERLEPGRCALKVGKELFVRAGPGLVREFVQAGHAVFLDLKFHDIPNTVAGACRAAAELGVWMLNVHVSGGRRMMEAAVEALAAWGTQRPRLIGVTVLTSLGREDLAEIGLDVEPAGQVERLAALARASGLDGVVCSPREAGRLRERMGADFLLVTPGVRPAGAETADQKRVMTPAEALAAGASHLVIGRPVTRAPDPMAALEAIERELGR